MTNEELLKKIEQGITNLTPQCQLKFEVHIVEHCSLNCKQCAHFSPLAEKSYLPVERYERDCRRLSELFRGEMSSILLLGGEPLLHPQITEIMRVTREAFPVGRIRIVTNGILLPKMAEDFWKACGKYDVEISPSYYPIKFDYDQWGEVVESKQIKYTPFFLPEVLNKLWGKAFPICPRQGGKYGLSRSNFIRCQYANHCVTLRDGRMYSCAIAAHALHLKKYFHLDIQLSDRDSVDIYSVGSGAELLEALAKPIPFCQYCDVVDVDKTITCGWGVSRRERYEWLAFEFTEDDIAYLKERRPVLYVFGAGTWGHRAIMKLQRQEIPVRAVLVTNHTAGQADVMGVPILSLEELGTPDSDSICLVALASHDMKEEVYPVLSQVGFRDVIPISGIE